MMTTKCFTVLTLLLMAATNVFCELPADLQKCNFGDTVCIAKTMENVLTKYFSAGIRGANLVPFDPLRVKAIGLGKNPKSPVSIDLNFRDVDFIGLSKAKIQRVAGFDKDLAQVIEVEAKVPTLSLKGPYTVDGQILFLPITGKGQAEIVFQDAALKIKLRVKPVDKNGQRYMKIENSAFSIQPQHARFDLSGLFNGNKELADNMLAVINENWRDILSELQPDISKALGLVVQGIVNNVFSKSPYESFFL